MARTLKPGNTLKLRFRFNSAFYNMLDIETRAIRKNIHPVVYGRIRGQSLQVKLLYVYEAIDFYKYAMGLHADAHEKFTS